MHSPSRTTSTAAPYRAIFITLGLTLASCVLAAGPAKPPLTPQPVLLKAPPPAGPSTPSEFPLPASVIDGWVSANEQAPIREHGWALWYGITSITPQSQGWPVFETWYTDTEVQAGKPGVGLAAQAPHQALRAAGRATHQFEQFRQLHHAQAPLGGGKPALRSAPASPGGLQVIGFNKFDANYANSVWSNNYNTAAGLWSVQNAWPVGTAPALRVIKPFVNTAVGLKPVFIVVAGPANNHGTTVMPYWLGDLSSGPSNSSNPANPTMGTWNQCVVVYSGATPPSGPLSQWKCANGSAPAGLVNVKEFYHFALSAAEAANIASVQPLTGGTVKAGDVAILVAMHMTTRENSNWTWQSFWWNYGQPHPYGAPPPNIAAPFNNYAMCSSYSMTVNPANSLSGKNVLCYNPYLETGLTAVNGTDSNCMSCHAAAAFGNNPNNLPAASGVGLTTNYPPFLNMSNAISVTNQADAYYYFACNTSTDFSWFLAGNVATSKGAPASNTPCANPAGSAPAKP